MTFSLCKKDFSHDQIVDHSVYFNWFLSFAFDSCWFWFWCIFSLVHWFWFGFYRRLSFNLKYLSLAEASNVCGYRIKVLVWTWALTKNNQFVTFISYSYKLTKYLFLCLYLCLFASPHPPPLEGPKAHKSGLRPSHSLNGVMNNLPMYTMNYIHKIKKMSVIQCIKKYFNWFNWKYF